MGNVVCAETSSETSEQSRLRILLTIHHTLNWNAGAAGSTLQLKREFEAKGHDVTVLGFDQCGAATDHVAWQLLFPWFVSWKLLRHGHTFDVVDSSTGDAWVWATLFRRLGSCRPALVTRSTGLEHIAHNVRVESAKAGGLQLSWRYPFYHGGLRLWEVRQSLRRSDLCVFLNRSDRDYAVNRLGVIGDRCCVVPNGIPPSLIGAPVDWCQRRLRIAHLGTFIERKGIRYLMPAISDLLREYPDIEVSLFGTFCSAESVLSHLPQELHDRVQIVERYKQDDLPSLLAGHQILVVASLSEGFGKTIIEGMACGLAVVSTMTPGAIDVIEDGSDGLLVSPRSTSAIKEGLERLILEPALLARVRLKGYETAQRYSWSSVASRRLRLYRGAIERRRRTGGDTVS